MKLKINLLYAAAVACFGVGLIYALGIEGNAQIGQPITDGQFITAIVMILLAIFFMRLGFAAEAHKERHRKIHQPQANTVKSGRKAG